MRARDFIQSDSNPHISWDSLDEGMSMNDKMLVFEEFHIRGNLLESNDDDKRDYFESLYDLSDSPTAGKKYIVAPLSLIGNRVIQLNSPSVMEFVGYHDHGLTFKSSSGEKTYPSKAIREHSIFNVFIFSTKNTYDTFRTALELKFDTDLGDVSGEDSVNEEFVTEDSFIDDSLIKRLEGKGYRQLHKGRGVDQLAMLAPNGSILKIFGTQTSNRGSMNLTKPQEAFKAFADYCNANPKNPFLPQFSSWRSFVYDNHPYLLINMERLFPFPNVENWALLLEMLADKAAISKSDKAKDSFVDSHLNQELIQTSRAEELFSHLGEEGFNLLWDTIYDLSEVAHSVGADMDLHKGNFMITHEGQIVIVDPFYTGDEYYS